MAFTHLVKASKVGRTGPAWTGGVVFNSVCGRLYLLDDKALAERFHETAYDRGGLSWSDPL